MQKTTRHTTRAANDALSRLDTRMHTHTALTKPPGGLPALAVVKGVLRGGKVTNYLLEKSRVTGQAAGERCFHVMHYLLEGTTARERSELRLLPARQEEFSFRSAP